MGGQGRFPPRFGHYGMMGIMMHPMVSSKMSLLKTESNDKLSMLGGANFPSINSSKTLSSVGFMMLATQVYIALSEWIVKHGPSIQRQVKANAFRLMVSLAVVMAQFYWFSPYYVAGCFGTTKTTLPTETFDKPELNPLDHSAMVPSPRAQLSLVQVDFHLDQDDHSHQPRLGSPDFRKQQWPSEWAQWNVNLQHRTNSVESLGADTFSKDPQFSWTWRQLVDHVINFLWKLVIIGRLCLIMLLFESIRQMDTLWRVCIHIVRDSSRSSKTNQDCPFNANTRPIKKSPVDTSYIERNRGYK